MKSNADHIAVKEGQKEYIKQRFIEGTHPCPNCGHVLMHNNTKCNNCDWNIKDQEIVNKDLGGQEDD